MDLHAIPHSMVAFALESAQAVSTEPTGFNTTFRPRAAIECFVPHIPHRTPPTEPFKYGVWQPLIAALQGLGAGYRFEFGAACVDKLVDAAKVYKVIQRLPENVVLEVMKLWPTIAEVVRPPSQKPLLGENLAASEVATSVVFAGRNSWFLRATSCSTKDSPKKGPVRSLHDVVQRLCSSPRATSALERALGEGKEGGEQMLTVYLVPFNKHMNLAYEYRCFCPPGSVGISAISMVRWARPWLPLPSAEQAKDGDDKSQGIPEGAKTESTPKTELSFDDYRRADRICKGATSIYQQVLAFASEHDARQKAMPNWRGSLSGTWPLKLPEIHLPEDAVASTSKDEEPQSISAILDRDGFSFDVLETKNDPDGIQLVKLNAFGALSGCGSCLFEWIRDAEALYGVQKDGLRRSGGVGKPGRLEFRVVQ